MKDKLEQKMYYTLVGFILSFVNLLLIETRFNFFGVICALFGVMFFVKALRIKLTDEER
jgi:hypothetical protein